MAETWSDHDGDLVAAAQRGERGALDALVRRHDRWVRGVVFSTIGRPGLIDDVVQHVWATVCQQIGTLSDPERWRSWLFRLARNAAIDAGQKNTRERKTAVALLPEHEEAAADLRPATILAASEERTRVQQAIRGLPAIYREPFVLKHIEDWSYAQISEAMGIPVDTVETRLVRARRLLREMLRAPDAEPDTRSRTSDVRS